MLYLYLFSHSVITLCKHGCEPLCKMKAPESPMLRRDDWVWAKLFPWGHFTHSAQCSHWVQYEQDSISTKNFLENNNFSYYSSSVLIKNNFLNLRLKGCEIECPKLYQKLFISSGTKTVIFISDFITSKSVSYSQCSQFS